MWRPVWTGPSIAASLALAAVLLFLLLWGAVATPGSVIAQGLVRGDIYVADDQVGVVRVLVPFQDFQRYITNARRQMLGGIEPRADVVSTIR